MIEEYLSSSQLVQRARAQSIQDRILEPETMIGGYIGYSYAANFMGWLSDRDDGCPLWGTPMARADYLEAVWRNDSRLSGVMFTMLSRLASLGWAISGPVDGLTRWYDLFAWAEENWTMFVKLVYADYLATDEGGVVETTRESYPRGPVTKLWHMDARRTIPGPIKIQGKVWPLIFRDQVKWKGLREGQFFRTMSQPSTDQLLRRLGFCFMSRILRYAALGDKLLQYKEERAGNLPPEGIATITGLTRPQVENAFAEYELARQQHRSQTFPGIMWFVANTYGQEARVTFTSFRDVWEGYNDREAHEIFMKVVSLDAGVDVGEFWQVEFHGATRAASWLQHTKARGKGPAEFIVDFERWATRTLPLGFVFRFDTPDDEQDLTVERIRRERIRNLKELWLPDPTGERLLDRDQVLELAAEWQVIPSRMVSPPERVATDLAKSLGRDVGIIRFPDRHVERVRSFRRGVSLEKKKGVSIPLEVAHRLVPIMKRWDVLDGLFGDVLNRWRRDVVGKLRDDPDLLDQASYWEGWGKTVTEATMDEFVVSALEGAQSTGLRVSFERINDIAREVAEQQAFDMVQLTGPQSIVRTRRAALERIKGELADGTLRWVDLEKRLEPLFGSKRAHLVSVSENTDLWASAQLRTAQEAGMREKRSERADAARPCPSGICIDAEGAGWVGIDDEIVPGYQRPKYHPGCYCYIALR